MTIIRILINLIWCYLLRCRKLPKALKEWQAFNELKKKIDDFNECCPLLELMANKAMKDRHWERIANVTRHKFDVESENFLLRNIMEAPLLENKEDIEVSYHLKKVIVVSVKLLFLWCLLVLWKLLSVSYCVDLWVLYCLFNLLYYVIWWRTCPQHQDTTLSYRVTIPFLLSPFPRFKSFISTSFRLLFKPFSYLFTISWSNGTGISCQVVEVIKHAPHFYFYYMVYL